MQTALKTKAEWLAFFYGLGFGHGEVWHLMDDLYALGLVVTE